MKTSRLEKVISGGQTGVDIAALKAARDAGLQTGGSIPKGFLTERGCNPSLAKLGLVETESTSYVPRTEANVRDSEATFWYGDPNSRGGKLTLRMCNKHGKAFFIINDYPPAKLFGTIQTIGYRVINVAGNRESVSPGIEARAYAILLPVFLGGTKAPGKKFCPDYGRPDMKHPMCQQCGIQGDCEEEYQERASQEATYESIRDAP